MKRKPIIVVLGTLVTLCLLAGKPFLLFGQNPLMSEEKRYASDDDRSYIHDPTPMVVTEVEPAPDVEWNFSADRLVAEHDSGYIQGEGNATLTRGKNTLRADFIRYYQETGWVLLRGDVRAMWQGDFLEASEAEFDLKSNLGWLKNGKVFVVKPHLYFESDYIRKYKGQSYTFKNAKVTACSGETPAWSFTASDVDVELDGFARLYHTAFRIKDVPVAYFPYARLPVSSKRESGFLLPEVATSSRFGLQVNLPYYWVINEEMDATFYENYMSDRGLMQGLELRHANDAHTKGLWRFDWMYDSQIAPAIEDEEMQFRADGLTRPHHERWWLRSKYNGYLGTPAWRTMVDLDIVSDQNYLREFDSGLSGYYASRDEFVKEFGRDIDAADSLERTSTAMVSRDYQNFGVAAKVEYTQNLAYMNGNNDPEKNPSLQRLPEIDAYMFEDDIPGTPLDLKASAKYDYFFRTEGTSGQRLLFQPVLSAPLHTSWVTVTPRLGLDQRFYAVSEFGPDGLRTVPGGELGASDGSDDKFQSRTNVDASVEMFSEMYRVYDLGGTKKLVPMRENVGESDWTSVKHSIVPRVEYEYRPTLMGQNDLPYFDEDDRVMGKSEVTYSLTNVFDRRRDTVSLQGTGEDAVPVLFTDYLDFAKVRLVQSYDYREAERNVDTNLYPRRPFSDILAEITIKPWGGLSMVSKTWYSPYIGGVTEHEHMLRYEYEGVGDIFFGYDVLEPIDEYNRRRQERLEILHLGANVHLTDHFTVGLDFRRDLQDGEDLEKGVSLHWLGECYAITFQYRNTPSNDSFQLMFTLFEF